MLYVRNISPLNLIFLLILLGILVVYLILNIKYKNLSLINALVLFLSPFIPWGFFESEGKTILLLPVFFPLTLAWLFVGVLVLIHEWKPKFSNHYELLVLIGSVFSLVIWFVFLFLELEIATIIAGNSVRDVERFALMLVPVITSVGLFVRSIFERAQRIKTFTLELQPN